MVSLLLHEHPDHCVAVFRQLGAVLLLTLLRRTNVQKETIDTLGETVLSEDKVLDHHPWIAA